MERRDPATWARMERLAASPATVAGMLPLVSELDVRAVFRQSACQPWSSSTPTNQFIPPRWASTSPITYRARSTSSSRAQHVPLRRTWRRVLQEIAEFLTGRPADVADDRVLATVLFTDIVDSTRRAAESATATGTRCSTRTTPSCGHNSLAFGAAR